MLSEDSPVKAGVLGRLTRAWWLWSRFSLRQIARNPLRVTAVIVSVALATTLWSAVLKVSIASVSSFEESLGFSDPSGGILVSPVGGRFEGLAVARCFGSLSSYADMIAIRREQGVLRSEQGSQVVSVAGVTGYGVSQGIAPARDSRWEVSLSARKALGLTPGERASLQVGDTSISFVIPEITGRALQNQLVEVVVPFEEIVGRSFVDSVALSPRGPTSSEFISTVSSYIRSCLAAAQEVRIETYEKPLERSANLLAAYRMNILIMAGVTLLVCGLLISQAAHVALRAELRELSILRSLGVSRFGCFGAVVLEGAVLSFCGALLGCTVGYPLAVWLTGFLINTAQEIYQVTIKPFGVGYNFSQAISILAATAIWGAISAAAAARGVLSLAPYRGTRREQIHNHPLQRGPLIALAVLGTSLCVGTIVFAEHFGGAVLAYLSVASVLLCVVLCSPLAIFLIATWLPFTRTIVAMRLAAGSLQVAGRHFLLSGIAASLALALMTGLSLMVSSFHGTLSRWSATRLAGDLFVSAALSGSGNEARIDARYVDAIRASPAFRAVVPYYETNSEVAQQPVVVGGTDIVSQCARSVYTFIEGGCTDDKNSQDAGAFISESAARKLSLAIGSKFRLEEASFSVRGILQEFGTEQPLIVLDEGNFTQRYPAHQPKTITLDLADQNNHKQAREWLASLAPDVLVIRDSKELRDLVDTLFKRTFRVTESVRWIVFVLAILGLISAGAQYLWERRWEFKIATIIGVPAHTVTASVGVEVASVALAALAVGLSAGGLIGFCLTRYINPAVFGWSLDFSLSAKPFVEGGLFLLVSVVLCVLIARKMLAVIIQAVRVADE